jgi:hypothetical protein
MWDDVELPKLYIKTIPVQYVVMAEWPKDHRDEDKILFEYYTIEEAEAKLEKLIKQELGVRK